MCIYMSNSVEKKYLTGLWETWQNLITFAVAGKKIQLIQVSVFVNFALYMLKVHYTFQNKGTANQLIKLTI